MCIIKQGRNFIITFRIFCNIKTLLGLNFLFIESYLRHILQRNFNILSEFFDSLPSSTVGFGTFCQYFLMVNIYFHFITRFVYQFLKLTKYVELHALDYFFVSIQISVNVFHFGFILYERRGYKCRFIPSHIRTG